MPGKRKRKQKQETELQSPYVDDYLEEQPDVVPFVKGFQRPTKSESLRAINFVPSGVSLPKQEELKAAAALDSPFLNCVPTEAFPAIPDPVCIDDWLAQYEEEGQTFAEYLRFVFLRSGRRKPRYKGSVIYLQPIGDEFLGEEGGKLSSSLLVQYTEAYYLGLRVQMLPPLEVQQEGAKFYLVVNGNKKLVHGRFNKETGRRQLGVDALLTQLSALKRSKQFQSECPDGLFVMAVTMEDLYSDEPDLFVAGMAAGGSGVAVFSFCRYAPQYRFSREFWYKWYAAEGEENKSKATAKKRSQKKKNQTEEEKEDKGSSSSQQQQARRHLGLLQKRAVKLLVHELGHLLGIDHCIHFECCMNGSGHLEEDFRQPMHLCPIELRKLLHFIGPAFDIRKRYELLFSLYSNMPECEEEARWVKRRLEH